MGFSSRGRAERFQPFQRERQVRAALGARDRVDLVDDDDLDATERLAGRAGEHQIQRLGRRDQDVRWVPGDLTPVLGGRVTGPARDADPWNGLAKPLGRHRDPGQRRPQVPLDVVGQRLEWRDVQDADTPRCLAGRRGAWIGGEPVEAPQECGEGLAAARRGVDQRVLTLGDRGPALCLGVGRSLEARFEPIADGGREGREGIARGCRRRSARRSGHGASVYRSRDDLDQMFYTCHDHGLESFATERIPNEPFVDQRRNDVRLQSGARSTRSSFETGSLRNTASSRLPAVTPRGRYAGPYARGSRRSRSARPRLRQRPGSARYGPMISSIRSSRFFIVL